MNQLKSEICFLCGKQFVRGDVAFLYHDNVICEECANEQLEFEEFYTNDVILESWEYVD